MYTAWSQQEFLCIVYASLSLSFVSEWVGCNISVCKGVIGRLDYRLYSEGTRLNVLDSTTNTNRGGNQVPQNELSLLFSLKGWFITVVYARV